MLVSRILTVEVASAVKTSFISKSLVGDCALINATNNYQACNVYTILARVVIDLNSFVFAFSIHADVSRDGSMTKTFRL